MKQDQDIILLGDPVVYRDDIIGFNELGVVTKTGSCMEVLWNDESHSRVEVYERLRPARLDEVDASCRIILENYQCL
ncbi:phosphohistidine phosphatase [Acinetobacter ursingii]|uniref:phosphohistidine phosphatase n=1 Tax=Acinetobacter ursingii TaxID=108980 RepID=UPI00124D1DFC|nr:phosphohistidine phosphatase [Acinetobacter ursingii]